MRRAGQRVRITAQLIEASSGAHLWADRYDRALDDIFAVQDEVVAQIAATLTGRIQATGVEQAKRKPTTDLVAYDLVLQGSSGSPPTAPTPMRPRAASSKRAVALDPDYAIAHAYLALAIFSQDWGTRRGARLAACLEHADRAVLLDRQDSRCHRILAMILLSAREFDRADHHSSAAWR